MARKEPGARCVQAAPVSRAEVTERLAALLYASSAILVGHGLHHDLHALKLDYWPIIDTARVFSFAGLPPSHTPGLAALSASVLGRALRQPDAVHDPRADALAALQLALRAAHGATPLALDAPQTKAAPDALRRLLVHSIPAAVTREQLAALFAPHGTLEACEHSDARVRRGRCACTLHLHARRGSLLLHCGAHSTARPATAG